MTMIPTATMQQSLTSLDRRLGTSWERTGLAKAKSTPECEVRLDRLEFTAPGFSESAILGIPGFRRTQKYLQKRKHGSDFLAYRRKTTFIAEGSISQLFVESEPLMRHVSPCKATLIARDETGLRPADVTAVFELVPLTHILRIEVALDFGFRSGVDGAYIREHGLFGKSRKGSVASLRCWDSWGTRRGAKFVRSYFKEGLAVHRVELQLNRKILRRYGIEDIFDFSQLASILPVNHIWFAEIDKEKMLHHLRMAGHWGREYRRILERVADSSGDLLAQCSVLRGRGQLKNVRRVLIPRAENGLVQDALKKWAAQWPRVANRLEAK
jgi:hypothetical protein